MNKIFSILNLRLYFKRDKDLTRINNKNNKENIEKKIKNPNKNGNSIKKVRLNTAKEEVISYSNKEN